MKLSTEQQSAICFAADCQTIDEIAPMQSLWAGQGELARLTLSCADAPTTKSLVTKQIAFSDKGDHPRGWNTKRSVQRKRHSYEVELNWYRQFAAYAIGEESDSNSARCPALVYSETSQQGMLLVLEDLAVDYPVRFTAGKDDRPTEVQIKSCIRWLAQFHARFLGHSPDGLWPVGGYWHLDTRPDEWQAMPESELKAAANALDKELASCPYQTLIHGDAKLANFCFDTSGERVAAVDFQYVGRGPGSKDVMLLLSSVMPDTRLLEEASVLVEYYFDQLSISLQQWQPNIDRHSVMDAWRSLHAVAWADFHRFLAGWSPGHWKIGDYCLQQTEQALLRLRG